MGFLQTSKNQALLVTDSTNAQDKGRHKGKGPKASDSNPKENQKNYEGSLGSKKKKKFGKKKGIFKKVINYLSLFLDWHGIPWMTLWIYFECEV